MGKIFTIVLIVIFLSVPCLVISKPISAILTENDALPSDSTLLWNFTTSNGVWSSPTVVDGVLYVGCEDPILVGNQISYVGNLYALNAANGDKLWNYSIPVGGSSPAFAGGILYVGSFDGNVYAFNASNGVKLWSYPARDFVSSSPAVANEIVYVGLNDGNLLALNGTNGKAIWNYQSYGGISSPVVKDEVVFASSNAYFSELTLTGNVYALNASNGKMLWDYNPHTFVSFPTVVDRIVYAGVGSNISALSSINGSQLWSIILVKQVGLSPIVFRPTAILDNVLYVGSSDGSVYALNKVNGEKIWNRSLGNQSGTLPNAVNGVTSPAAANGVVYVGSNDGNLYALSATIGEILWNYTISDRDHAVESSPVVDNGVVYIGSGARNIYAFGNRANSNNSSGTIPIITITVVFVIIIALWVKLIFKRSKSKSFNQGTQVKGKYNND